MPMVCTSIKGEFIVIDNRVYCLRVNMLQEDKILTGQAQWRRHAGCTAVPGAGQDHWPLNCQKKGCNITGMVALGILFRVCVCAWKLPWINKVEHTQFLRQGGSQAVCIQDYVVVEESWICVQKVHLCCCSCSNAGVTVAHYKRNHTVCY